MRYALILACVAILAGTVFHALTLGTQIQGLSGAPQIQAKLEAQVTEIVAPLTPRQIDVSADGRSIRLRGQVESDAQQQAIRTAVSSLALLGDLDDDLIVLPTATPFTFTAQKRADGTLDLSGHVPDRRSEDAILAKARMTAGSADVSANLTLAAGAPDAFDWVAAATLGLEALSRLTMGRLDISDDTLTLRGQSPDQTGPQALAGLIGTTAPGTWVLDVAGPAPAGGLAFQASRTADGAVRLDGDAPDQATRQDWLETAGQGGAGPVTDDLRIVSGPADPDHDARVRRALAVLALLDSGAVSVTAKGASVKGEVGTDADLAAVRTAAGDDWQIDIAVQDPTPVARVTLILTPDGRLQVAGILPDGLAPSAFDALAPQVDRTGLAADQGRPMDWTQVIRGLEIVLPRFGKARVAIAEQHLTIDGDLRQGYSVAGSEAALNSVLDRGWRVDIHATQTAPMAELVVSMEDGQIALAGVLPQGLSPDDALAPFGPEAGANGLTAGGSGDPAAWTAGLTGLARAAPLFVSMTADMTHDGARIDGVLKPGYAPRDVQDWLTRQMGSTWQADVSAQQTQPAEGDARTDLDTGEDQTFRGGYWLPMMDFDVSSDTCAARMDAAVQAGQIRFLTGSARIDPDGRALLNRLAAIALHCLSGPALALEIQGHTDSTGTEPSNQALGQARADAVAAALQDRGVRPDALTARGLGASQPVASNDTEAGRALNRRITFVWTKTDG